MRKHIHRIHHRVKSHLRENKHMAAVYIVAAAFFMLALFSQWTPLRAADEGTVSGLLVEPNGTTAVANASVTLHNANWSYSGWKSTDSNGGFSFANVPAGAYKLEIYIYSSTSTPLTYFAPDAISVTVASGTLDLGSIAMLSPNVFGKVTAPDGTTGISGASVTIHTGDWMINKYTTTDANGAFSMALNTNGTYTVEVWTYNTDYSRPDNRTITYAGSALYLDGTHDSTVMVAVNPALRGKVLLNDGTTAARWASVTLYDSNNTGVQWASTNESGIFKIDSVGSGTYTLKIFPPYDTSGLVGPDPISVTLTKGTTNTTYLDTPITLSRATKTISGTVTRTNGTRVTQGWVNAWQYSGGGYATTAIASDGTFSFLVGSGEWMISTYPNWNNGAPDWTYVGSPKKVSFTKANAETESATVEFSVLSFTATVKGHVTLPTGGVPSQSDYVSVSAWSEGGGGNWAQVDANGDFSMKMPPGTFNISLYSSSSQFTAPALSPLTLKDDQTHDYGTISLLAKDATITGAVRDNNGRGLANQSVNAWIDGGSGWGWTQTDSNGNYSLPVSAGRWCVNSYPSWNSDIRYVATDEPQCGSVAAKGTRADVNFTFALADATLGGTVVDEAGQAVTGVYGWLEVRKSGQTNSMYHYSSVGGSISGGTFSVKVPGGTWDMCPSLGYGGDYSASDCQTVTIDAGGSKTDLKITLLPNNATVIGNFKDTSGKVLTDVFGSVTAQRSNSNNYLWSMVDNGSYRLKGAAGTWKLGCWVDPNTSAQYYLSGVCDADVKVGANETVTHDIVLQTADASIAVTVIDPDGKPVPNALVSVDTSFGETKTVSYGMYGYWFNRNKSTDQNGALTVKVPSGTYFVSASVPTDFGYINPKKTVVTTTAENPGTVSLQFLKPDATITGKVTIGGEPAPAAFVSASNDEGGYAETTTAADGTYTIPVTSGETWDVIVAAEDSASKGYRQGDEIDVAKPGTVAAGTIALSDGKGEETTSVPEASTTTSSTNTQMVVAIENGASVTAPANSLAQQNTSVILTIEPTIETPETATAVPAMPLAYDITVQQQSNGQELSNFPSDVTICLPYNETEVVENGLSESELTIKYWNETADTYQTLKTSTVDEDNNKVCGTTDHMTKFILASRPVEKKSITPGLAEQPTVTPVVTPDVTELNTKQIAVLTSSSGRGPVVTLYNAAGKKSRSFRPFSILDRGDFVITSGNVTGDTLDEIIVYDQSGRQKDVRIFSTSGKRLGTVKIAQWGKPSVLVANVNKDVLEEIVVSNLHAPKIAAYGFQGKRIKTLATIPQPFSASGQVTMATGNITGDSAMEVIVSSATPKPGLGVYQVDTARRIFRSVAQANSSDLTNQTLAITVADVHGDSHQEIIWRPTNLAGQVTVATVKNRTLSPLGTVAVEARALVTTGDLTSDSKADLVVASGAQKKLTVYSVNSRTSKVAKVTDVTPFTGASAPFGSMLVGDLNADGKGELVVSRSSGSQLQAYQLTAKNQFQRLTSYTMAAKSATAGRLSAVDLDGDGRREIMYVPNKNSRYLPIISLGSKSMSVWKLLTVGARNYKGSFGIATPRDH